jgi:hypothetical protein
MSRPEISDKRVMFLFVFAAVCQALYFFSPGGRVFAYLAFGAVLAGALESVSRYLYDRGREGAGEAAVKIYTDGEDRK